MCLHRLPAAEVGLDLERTDPADAELLQYLRKEEEQLREGKASSAIVVIPVFHRLLSGGGNQQTPGEVLAKMRASFARPQAVSEGAILIPSLEAPLSR